MDWITNPEIWASFLTLLVMEIVLGIDNIVFISILTNKLPPERQKKARIMGLGFALVVRILLLLSITWVMTLTKPLFNGADWIGLGGEWPERLSISGRDLILIVGGLFLLYKSIIEIHGSLEGDEAHQDKRVKSLSFTQTIIQIGLLDLVFGLDSVITAVGMADHVEIMIAAVVISMIMMVFTVHSISGFIDKHPSVKILALSFLLLIGISLIAEGVEESISKGYIYFAMGFSIFVEFLVIRSHSKKKEKPVILKKMISDEP